MATICLHGGNFNPLSSSCTCPIGFGGFRCEQFVLPACRTPSLEDAAASKPSFAPCTVERPLHCDCLAQCAREGAFIGHLPRFCFTLAPGVEPLSDVPAEEALGTRYFARIEVPEDSIWEAGTGRRRGAVGSWDESRELELSTRELALRDRRGGHFVPLSRCPLGCSGRGGCVLVRPSKPSSDSLPRRSDATTICRCDPWYKGNACEIPTNHAWCWNGCGGRGQCVDGFCQCDIGFFGPGCAYSWPHETTGGPGDKASSGSQRASEVENDRLLRIHVYDTPPLWTRRQTSGADDDEIFATMHIFLGELLALAASGSELETGSRAVGASQSKRARGHNGRHKGFGDRHEHDTGVVDAHVEAISLLHTRNMLTPDPSSAHLLLLPAFGTNVEFLPGYYKHAVAMLESHPSTSRWWLRRHGTDHIWWNVGDAGGCDLSTMRNGVQRGILVAHYFRFNESAAMLRSLLPHRRCGNATKDIAVPPAVPTAASAAFLAAGMRPMMERPIKFYFVGSVPGSNSEGFNRASDDELGRIAYSEGARQLAWRHLRHLPGHKIMHRSATYVTDWSQSRVCLAALGQGWGVRLAWAIAAGCIPLLPSSAVAPWWNDIIPYDKFSIMDVDKFGLRSLPTRLQAISDVEMEEKHQGALAYRPLFLWPFRRYTSDSGGGRERTTSPSALPSLNNTKSEGVPAAAFIVTMHQLCVRAIRHTGNMNLDCSLLLPGWLQHKLRISDP